MKDSSFHLHWIALIVSFFFGIFAFIGYVVFTRTDRRDKIYSSLLGWVLSMAVGLIILHYNPNLMNQLSK